MIAPLYRNCTEVAQHRQQITDLEDGELQIYVRSDTRKPLWHARTSNPAGKGYLTKSLKTVNKEKAAKRAKDWYDEVRFKHKHGLNLRTKSVPQICALYLQDLEKQLEAEGRSLRPLRDYKPIVERYVKGYFKNRRIDTITNKDVAAFKDWCVTYWTSGPGSQEKSKIYYRDGKRIVAPRPKHRAMTASGMTNVFTVLRGVFKTAERHDAIRSADIPTITLRQRGGRKRGQEDNNARAAFSRDEYVKLYRFLRYWHKTGKTDEHKHRKELLKDYVLILVNSGIRPGTESDGLRWKHVKPFIDDWGTEQITMTVSGKTGSRDLVPMPRTKIYLDRIKARRREELGHDPSPDEYVFCLPDGTEVKQDYLRQLFKKALKEAGLLQDAEGRSRTLYSCRHTYATFRILYGRVSVYTLAENMGTSVKMISEHYAHLKPRQAAPELTQRISRKKAPS
mgnify:CR=1 FL=1